MFEKILFPTCGSPLSGKIAETIVGLIKEKPDRQVTILTVVDYHQLPIAVDYQFEQSGFHHKDFVLKNVEEIIEKAVKVFKENNVPFEVRVEKGEPTKTIVQVADEIECDLMVVGHHGESKLSDYLFKGDMTANLINESHCPVMVIK